MILNKIIDSLIVNLPSPTVRNDIDLILDGGAFRGSYTVGCLRFLKQIEQKHWVKVHRISGCSIGSISALLYLTDNLDLCESFYKESRNHFINNHNLEYGKFWLYGFKKKYLKKKSYIKFNNRLFITYWDTLLCKQIVKSTYTSNSDLIESVIKSCFVPYVFNGNLLWKDRFVDGFYPYIFPKQKDRKILTICLIKSNNILEMCCIKNEINNFGRVYDGILDFYLFLKNKPSKYCNYTNTWGIKEHLFFKIRIILAYYFIYLYAFLKRILFIFTDDTFFCNDLCLVKKIISRIYKQLIVDYCI